MKLQITGKNLDIGDALRGHIAERIEANVGRYFDDRASGAVVLVREGHDFKSDCSVKLASGLLLHATALEPEPYASFDAAADRLEKRLRRYKRRLKDHHNRAPRPEAAFDAANYVIGIDQNADDDGDDDTGDNGINGDANPPIIAEDTTQISELTVSEAVMRLDLTDAPFLLFKNAAHGGLNVIYRRDDGNLGWLDPQATQKSS